MGGSDSECQTAGFSILPAKQKDVLDVAFCCFPTDGNVVSSRRLLETDLHFAQSVKMIRN
jgi:hypothetical protein